MSATAARRPGPIDRALTAAWLCLFAAICWLASLDSSYEAQLVVGASLLGILMLMKPLQPAGPVRLIFLMIGLFLTSRYMIWRTLYTLPPIDEAGFIPGLLLYLAELYAFLIMLLGLFVGMFPLHRQLVPPDGPPAAWPSVDVFIPTYDESPEIVEATVIAAAQLDYPRERLRIYLLDDGGTAQKLRGPGAPAAAQRAARLQAICAQEGATYLARPANERAKAGNLNAALKHSNGDLVLVLDADHAPSEDLLINTVRPFQRDPKLFLVQTPHFFVSPDPVERNLQTFGHMPGEPEMFYRAVQHGLDFWNASFFCGSAALLRRRCLEEIGGFSGISITEDVETALELHARGYNSAYIDRPMVAGLSPETFSGFAVQRTRWCQGMTQVLLLKRPMFKRGLTLPQRLAYTACSSFWLFGAARLIFYIAPLFYLFFGLSIYEADARGFLAYTAPHVIAMLLVSNVLHGSVRWPFVSELYETLQSPTVLRAMLTVLRNPRKPAFVVTPKGETVSQDYLSPLARPFLAMWLLLIAGFAAAALRYWLMPEQRAAVLLVVVWNLVNFMVIGAALGVVLEHVQIRRWPRMPNLKHGRLELAGKQADIVIEDLSLGGGRIAVPEELLTHVRLPATGSLIVDLPRHGTVRLPVVALSRDAADGTRLHCRFTARAASERELLVELFYGSSTPWLAFLAHRRQAPGVLVGTWLFLRLSLRYMVLAVAFLLRGTPHRGPAEAMPRAGVSAP